MIENKLVRLNLVDELGIILPNHENELSKVDEIIEKIKTKIDVILKENTMSNKIHENLYEETIRILDFVGNLSLAVFNIEEQIETLYIKKYIHDPIKVKLFWYEHYSELHRPYSLKKNRCFKILGELDENYFKKFKKFPENYNI